MLNLGEAWCHWFWTFVIHAVWKLERLR